MAALLPRLPRVQFEHPVRVAALEGPPRIIRTLTSNLSREGAFVRFAEPLGPGLRVALSLEAAGHAFPLVEGSVRWCRPPEAHLPGGFGMRFERFLHPRGGELVISLVDSLHRGLPLRPAPPRRRWLKLGLWGLGAAALSAGATAGLLAWQATTPAPASAVPVALAAALDPPAVPPAPALAAAEAPPPPAEAPAATRAEGQGAAPAAEGPAGAAPAAAADAAPVVAAPLAPPAPTVQAHRVGSAPARAPAPALLASAARSTAARAPPSEGELSLPSGAARALAWREVGGTLRLEPRLRSGQVRRQFLLERPPRAVFDLDGASPAGSHTTPGSGPHISRIRVGAHGGGTRVVVDLLRTPRRATEEGGAMVLEFETQP